MMGHPVKMSGRAIAAALRAKSREPFEEVLHRFLEAEPDTEAVKEFAEKYPDRWAQAVTMMGRLSGYHEKLNVDHSHAVAIAEMSDMELMQKYRELQAKIGGPEGSEIVPLRLASQSTSTPSAADPPEDG